MTDQRPTIHHCAVLVGHHDQVDPIVHLTSATEWAEARERGDVRAESLDTEGFLHCSTVDQIVGVANRFYRGTAGLVLLVIDPDRLTVPLRWEHPVHPDGSPGSVGDPLFPHVYGPIVVESVVAVLDFPVDEDGRFELPAGL